MEVQRGVAAVNTVAIKLKTCIEQNANVTNTLPGKCRFNVDNSQFNVVKDVTEQSCPQRLFTRVKCSLTGLVPSGEAPFQVRKSLACPSPPCQEPFPTASLFP